MTSTSWAIQETSTLAKINKQHSWMPRSDVSPCIDLYKLWVMMTTYFITMYNIKVHRCHTKSIGIKLS